jgi:hypothetical protein
MPSRAQNAPTGKGIGQALGGWQGPQLGGVHPARVGGIVARAERSAGDRGRIVPDVEDIAVAARPPNGTEEASRLDLEARFLAHLAHECLGVGLAGLNPSAGKRPQPGPRRMPALDEQQPTVVVFNDGAHTRDYGAGHTDKYRRRRGPPARHQAVTAVPSRPYRHRLYVPKLNGLVTAQSNLRVC